MTDEPTISAVEFEAAYAAASGITVEQFRKWNTVRRCECGEECCTGWAKVRLTDIADWDADAPMAGQVAGSVIEGRP